MDDLKSLHELGQYVAAEQDNQLAKVDLDPVRRRVLRESSANLGNARRRIRHRSLALAAVAGTLAVAAATVLTLNLGHPAPPSQLQVTVGGEAIAHDALDHWWSAPKDAALPIEFSDGTQVDLQPEGRARVLQVGRDGAHIVLESGASSVHVVPRESANWQVSAGPFLVHVVGTSFDIEWGPDNDLFVLRLHSGKVNLSGCLFGAGRSVVAGETVTASCKRRNYEIATRDARQNESDRPALSAQPPAPSVAPVRRAARTEAPPPGEQRRPSWRSLAQDGKYPEAIEAANAVGFAGVLASANASDLALLGDAARYSNKPGKAIQAYETLRQRFPGSPRAATAAYSLARSHFDQRGAYGRAAHWFGVYLKEQPSGPLAREAQGRLMESLNRAGNPNGARRTAASYLRRYPDGPHAPLARTLVSKKP